MADDPYETWHMPWRRGAAALLASAALLAGTLIGASRIYEGTIRPKVQVRRDVFPSPRLEVAHEIIGPRAPADPGAVDRAMAAEQRAGWGDTR